MVLGILMMLMQQQPAAPAMPASGIAKVEVTPQTSEIQVGQAIQFHARAVDSAGHEVPGPELRWLMAASFGNGTASVDSTGLVKAGYKGRVEVTAIAMVPGTAGRGIGQVPLRVVPAAGVQNDRRSGGLPGAGRHPAQPDRYRLQCPGRPA